MRNFFSNIYNYPRRVKSDAATSISVFVAWRRRPATAILFMLGLPCFSEMDDLASDWIIGYIRALTSSNLATSLVAWKGL